jgi:hypothetical protein
MLQRLLVDGSSLETIAADLCIPENDVRAGLASAMATIRGLPTP